MSKLPVRGESAGANFAAGVMLAVLTLVLGAPGSASAHLGGDECRALGGSIDAGACRITTVQVASDQAHGGPFTINGTLHITSSGILTVPPAAGGSSLTLIITGGLIIDASTLGGGRIVGDVSNGPGIGAAISIYATGDIVLRGTGTTGALISSNHTTSCTSGRGGTITLSAMGDITTEAGSAVTVDANCRAGEIDIFAGGATTIAGVVSSEGTTTTGRGGPITVNGGCNLTVGDTGTITSKGADPGADLVHLEGGCDVTINGLVRSTGPGHAQVPDRRCHAPARPDKPASAAACVEVWSGGSLTINSAFPHNGEVNADTAQSGGVLCCAWIDLLASGPIQINGDSVAPFSVHANQMLTNSRGGFITVKSTQDTVWARGLALQADAQKGGSRGGGVTVEAHGNVTLDDAQLSAAGDPNATGGYGIGGNLSARSFNGILSWKNLAGGVATGDVRPMGTLVPMAKRGMINLTYCTSADLTGTVFPADGTPTTPAPPVAACGGDPTLLPYVTLPTCACGPVQPDVAVNKSTSTPVVVAGGLASYSITVSANGSDDSENVVLTDQLPGGLTWAVTGLDAGACSIASGVLTCAFGTMPVNTSKTITLSATTKTSSCSSLANTATVTADLDGDRTNNISGPVTITVNCPDVAVVKTTSTPTITIGANAIYNITVRAGGTGASTNVGLTDTLPAGLTWAVGGTNAAACAIASGVLTCTFGTIPQGSAKTITLSAPTTPAKCGSISNTATVTADADTDPSNNSSGPVSITIGCSDVSVVKTTSTPSIAAGDVARYTITVTAGGTSKSNGVTLTDTLPPGLAWTLQGPDMAACSIAGGTLTCAFGTLSPGNTRTVGLKATTGAGSCGVISNTAVGGADGDADPSNNSSGPVSITIGCSDVSVVKTTSTPSIAAGDDARYTITVTVGGTSNSSAVTLTDTLPAGLAWTVGGADAQACAAPSPVAGGSVLTCNFGTLSPGATRTITLRAMSSTANCPALDNTAVVSSINNTKQTSSASGPVRITVVCPVTTPDASVAKSATTPLVTAGGAASYRITVAAAGGTVPSWVSKLPPALRLILAGLVLKQATSNGVILTDTLPTGLTWTVAGTDAAACSPASPVAGGTTLTCNFGTLTPGTTRTITLTAVTTTANCGSIANTAVISSTNDTNPANNTSGPIRITVTCPTTGP